MAAVLMLGADGVWIGTRFLASEEATVDQSYEERLIQATETGTLFPGCSTESGTPRAESCATARSRCGNRRGGLSPVCALEKGRLSPKAPTVSLWNATQPSPAWPATWREGLPNWAGHGVGLVNRIQPPADIIKEIAEKAVQVMRKANDLIRE